MNETRRYLWRRPATVDPIARQNARTAWANMQYVRPDIVRGWIDAHLWYGVNGKHFGRPADTTIAAELDALRAEFEVAT